MHEAEYAWAKSLAQRAAAPSRAANNVRCAGKLAKALTLYKCCSPHCAKIPGSHSFKLDVRVMTIERYRWHKHLNVGAICECEANKTKSAACR